jgi:hypothetical protein
MHTLDNAHAQVAIGTPAQMQAYTTTAGLLRCNEVEEALPATVLRCLSGVAPSC